MNKAILQKIVIAVVVLVLLAVVAVFVIKSHPSAKPAQVIDVTGQPTRGNANAKVHIVIFEDLKCIACKHFNNTVLPEIKKQYIDTGVAQYTVINVAFIPGSMPAANAARCLYQQNPDWFFQFVDTVYQHQPPENENWATIPKLMEFASIIPGVNADKLSRCIYDSPYTGFIENNFKQAAKLQGPTVATPAVYVNGRQVEPPTADNLQKAIDAAQ